MIRRVWVGIGMLLSKMLVPIHAFHTDPLAAVTAREVGDVLTANQTETAVVTEAHALGAVFLAVGADDGALLAGAAILTHQHAFRAQIAAFAECFGTFQTVLSAALTKGHVPNIAFTAGAMEARGNGAIQTEILIGIDLGAVAANAAFHAEFSAAFTVALRAIGAVHPVVDGAFLTDGFSHLLGAVVTGRTAIHTLAAFIAPFAHIKIALVAVGAVITVIDGAFLTNNHAGFI